MRSRQKDNYSSGFISDVFQQLEKGRAGYRCCAIQQLIKLIRSGLRGLFVRRSHYPLRTLIKTKNNKVFRQFIVELYPEIMSHQRCEAGCDHFKLEVVRPDSATSCCRIGCLLIREVGVSDKK
ncbi:MAG: hypothetical protein SFW66_09535 [Gammaproteobacteria bacterium]|nr:hypothetical protein [Gammaproteobacteria bacterium]